MADDDVNLFACHRTACQQESTGAACGVAVLVDVLGEVIVVEMEDAWVVEECAVDATAVRTFDVYDFPTFVCQCWLLEQVFEYATVLYFGNSDDGRCLAELARSEF